MFLGVLQLTAQRPINCGTPSTSSQISFPFFRKFAFVLFHICLFSADRVLKVDAQYGQIKLYDGAMPLCTFFLYVL